MYTSFFNNSSLDYDKKNKAATIWAFSKNVALIFDKPFAFKMPNLDKTKYSIYAITKKETLSLRGVLIWPAPSSNAVKITNNNVELVDYDYHNFKQLVPGNTYVFTENKVLENGSDYFENNTGIVGIVFRFETSLSRLDIQEFYFQDEVKITDLKLNNNNYELSYNAESFYTKNNLTHYLKVNEVKEEIKPILEGAYKHTLTGLSNGLSKVNIIIDSGYATQISKTLYIKKGEDIKLNSDKSTNIVLYAKDDKNYTTNGEGILRNITNIKVTEILNGIFNLELELSLVDKLANEIKTGCLIKCPVSKNKNRQLFKVRNVTRGYNKVNVFAQHIGISKLSGNYVTNEYLTNTNALTAMNELMSNTIIPSEVNIDGTYFGENKEVNIKKGKVLDILINNSDSIKNIYNCDFEFDNFTLKVFEKRGKESQNTLRDGKNILEIEEDIDDLDICTVIIPYSADGITVPELTVTSPNMSVYDDLYCKEYTFQDIKLDEINDTEGKVQEALRKACMNLFNIEKIDIPISSYKVSTKDLKDKFDDVLELGDEIPCYHKKLGLHLIGRVVGREFNPITMENTSLDINFRKKSLNNILNLKMVDETIKSKRDFSTKKYVNDLVNTVVESLDKNTINNSYSVEKVNINNLETLEYATELDYRLSVTELGL